MKDPLQKDPALLEACGRSSRLPWVLAAGCVVVIFIALLLPRKEEPTARSASTANSAPISTDGAHTSTRERHFESVPNPRSSVEPAPTAEEIVSNKVAQFARRRRKLAHAMAEHFKIAFPDEFERFFDAAEAGRYDEMKAIYKSLREQRESGADKTWYGPHWRAIIETQGAADVAHDWPAQKLLDYGNAVLGSLRPGMVYVGGTDPGCFIPTLLNETSDGERHIVLTQNALADGSYLDYWRATAQQLLSDPATPEESDPRKAYSKMVSSQAGLLLARKFRKTADVFAKGSLLVTALSALWQAWEARQQKRPGSNAEP